MPPLRASFQSRAFVSVAARERDRGRSACTTADDSVPFHSSCKFPLNELAEIYPGCVALITQLCPKQHADVFILIKVTQCPEPQSSESALYISRPKGQQARKARALPTQTAGPGRFSLKGCGPQSHQDSIANLNRG